MVKHRMFRVILFPCLLKRINARRVIVRVRAVFPLCLYVVSNGAGMGNDMVDLITELHAYKCLIYVTLLVLRLPINYIEFQGHLK